MKRNKLCFLYAFLSVFAVVSLSSIDCNAQKKKKKKGGFFSKIIPPPKLKDTQDTLQLIDSNLKYPKIGKVVDTLTIEAMDKSFILKGGETFEASFWAEGWVNPTNEFAKSFNKSTKGKKVKVIVDRKRPIYETTTEMRINPITKKEEAKEIRKFIRFEPYQEVLYGLLEFNTVHKVCSGEPTTRAYYISIADKYIEAARGGNISVVYEYYKCEPVEGSGSNNYTTWVMWLSDIPF